MVPVLTFFLLEASRYSLGNLAHALALQAQLGHDLQASLSYLPPLLGTAFVDFVSV